MRANITTVLLITSIMQISASGFAQKITFSQNDITLKSLFMVITKQTGFSVFYSDSKIDQNRLVDVHFKDTPLDQVFKDIDVSFLIKDKNIIVQERANTLLGRIGAAFNTIDVRGLILDEKNSPLPGASVRVKGSKQVAITNETGIFNLKNVPEGATLVISFIGYFTREIAAKEEIGNISLILSPSKLKEFVVVGYGTQERRDLTGSVGKITGVTLTEPPVESFDKALAGRITGVMVTQKSGLLGEAPTISIRGNNSLNNGNNPLYVLDGVPIIRAIVNYNIATNPLGDINPYDIESIEVLKDGSATAIYGSRAANGVVLITTKKGGYGKTEVNYDSWFSISQTAKRRKLLSAAQFIEINNEKFRNAGLEPQAFPTLDPNGRPYDTDWQKVIFRSSFSHNHNLSVSGGTDKTTYYFSGGFSDLKGIAVNNSQRKYMAKANVEQKALNIFTFGFNTAISYVQNNGVSSRQSMSTPGNVHTVLGLFPNVPVYNPDGSYNMVNNVLGRGANKMENTFNLPNIKAILDNDVYRNQNTTINGNAFASAKIIEGLTIRTQIGINSLYGEDYSYKSPIAGDGYYTNGEVFQQYNPSFNYVWTNNLSYNKTLGNHKLGVVAGTEFQKTRMRNFISSGTGLSDKYFGPNNLIYGTLANQLVGGGITENAINSYFGRVNYSYDDRYLLTLTYRSDRLSSLGPDAKSASLPGVSIGWRLSDERFFKNSNTFKFIDELKIRASYAKTGNADIGDYPFSNAYFPSIYGSQNGATYYNFGVNNLQYETSNKYDIGLDASLLKDRINITADFYYNNNNNLILNVPVPPSMGIPGNSIVQNVGALYNRGFEFAINSKNIVNKEFTWTTGFNISFNKNKITELYNGAKDILTATSIYRVGQPRNVNYIYKAGGVNPANGNPLYVKSNGQIIQGNLPNATYYIYDPKNPTDLSKQSNLTTEDMVLAGSPIPTYFGSLTNTFTYKNFDLTLYFVFSGGNKILNGERAGFIRDNMFVNHVAEVMNRWTHPGQITDIPKLYYGASNFETSSTAYLESGSFIRAQQIKLGYSLPLKLIQRIKLNKLNVYAAVDNAFLITKYKGPDPEMESLANPRARTITFGLNVGF